MSQFENLHVTIISPERTLFDAKVEAVFVPGEKGRFEILKNHALSCLLLKQELLCALGIMLSKSTSLPDL